MSKNNNNDTLITLTDPDTGVTLSIPDSNVTNHDYDGYDEYITFSSDDTTTVTLEHKINSGILRSGDLTTIYERPSNNTIRKRYTGHKKIHDISDIGIHTLEKISKRGN